MFHPSKIIQSIAKEKQGSMQATWRTPPKFGSLDAESMRHYKSWIWRARQALKPDTTQQARAKTRFHGFGMSSVHKKNRPIPR